MPRRHPLVATLVGTLALSGVSVGACGDDPDPEPVAVTQPGTAFDVDVGDQFTIILESNATTGFAWELETPPVADVVRLVDDVYVEPGTDLVGASGRQELTFEAVSTGASDLSLWYVRSFDDPKEPADRAVFGVVVGDS